MYRATAFGLWAAALLVAGFSSHLLQRFRLCVFVTLAVVSALSPPLAMGANIYWDGTGTSWNLLSNWSTSSSATTPNPFGPPGAADTARFNISTVNTAQTVNLNAAQSALGLIFNSTGAVLIQSGTGTNTLTLGANGITVNSGAGADTINSAMILGAAQSWSNDSSNTLTVNGDISNGSNLLSIAGSGNATIGGVLGSGAGGLSMNGTGTLTLSNSNTFTGGVTIAAGTLQLGNASALNATTPNAVVFGASSTGTLSLNGNSVTVASLSSNATPGTPVVQNASATPATLTINNGGGLTYAGVLQDGAGALGLTMNGGAMTLAGSNANTFTGAVMVNNGTLTLNKSSGVRAVSSTLIIGDGVGALGSANVTDKAGGLAGANVMIKEDGTLDASTYSPVTTVNSFTMSGGTVLAGPGLLLTGDITTSASGNTATIQGENTYLTAATHTFTVAKGTTASGIDLDATCAFDDSGGAAAIVKAGPGTMRLSGGEFSGGFSLNAGTLIIPNGGHLSTGPLTLNGGTIQPDTAPITLANAVTLAQNSTVSGANDFTLSGAMTLSGNRTLTVTNTALTSLTGSMSLGASTLTVAATGNYLLVNGTTLSGAISGSGGLVLNSGRLTLAGNDANTFTGPVTVNDGVMVLAKPSGVRAVSSTLNIGDGIGAPASASVGDNGYGLPVGVNLTIKQDGAFTGSSTTTFSTLTMTGGQRLHSWR